MIPERQDKRSEARKERRRKKRGGGGNRKLEITFQTVNPSLGP